MKQIHKFISLQYIVDVKNYKESFDKWMKIRAFNNPAVEQCKTELFNKYLYVIKPVIHRFNQIINKYPPCQFGLYSSTLNQKQIQIIKKALSPLNNYSITTQVPHNLISNQQLQKKLEKKCKQIYRLSLNEKPTNEELKWWDNQLDVEPISIEGTVIAGKGEGGKSLGMPTANLQVTPDLQKQLDKYPNGVYLVNFDFLNGQSYKGAGCLGTNPHYQNLQQSRKIEVYVLHDFGQKLFYGSKVVVTLKNLIRFQGKFHTFDSFLQAMHNDIYITRQIWQKQSKSKL